MKERTIEEIHDKEIGHRKFAKFVDLATEKGHTITNIKEFNEKFKFEMDGEPVEYDKHYKCSAKYVLQLLEENLNGRKELQKMRGDK